MSESEKQPGFDYSILSKRVSPLEVLSSIVKRPNTLWGFVPILVMVAIITVLVSRSRQVRFESMSGFILWAVIIIAFMAFGVIRQSRREIIMKAFAAANGLQYISQPPRNDQAGLIFDYGRDRRVQGYQFVSGSVLDMVSNYSCTTGSGKSRQTHLFGFVKLKLPRRLPHMVLDAKANNILKRFSNLPTNFDKDQRLSLEGDFNEYFTLYVPKEYETDALYVFTPDIMELMINDSAHLDVEIIDDNMYFYSSSGFNLTDPKRLESLITLAEKIAKKFNRQVDYYADRRIDDRTQNIIAEPGQRLSERVSWLVIVFVAIILALNFLPVIFSWFF